MHGPSDPQGADHSGDLTGTAVPAPLKRDLLFSDLLPLDVQDSHCKLILSGFLIDNAVVNIYIAKSLAHDHYLNFAHDSSDLGGKLPIPQPKRILLT